MVGSGTESRPIFSSPDSCHACTMSRLGSSSGFQTASLFRHPASQILQNQQTLWDEGHED